jgi:spore germination cell wall hydrolase CwlJ-like protein
MIEAAVFCMALAVYHEARGEPVAGQRMVAQVALNRANGNPKQVCNEVFRPRQFSWANGKVVKTRRGWALHESLRPTERNAWAHAQQVARYVLQRGKHGATTHFHQASVKPKWAVRCLRPVVQIGRHVFYKPV